MPKAPRCLEPFWPLFGVFGVFSPKKAKNADPQSAILPKMGVGSGVPYPPTGVPFDPFRGRRVSGLWGRVGFLAILIFTKTRLQHIYPGLVTKKLAFCTKSAFFELFVTSPRKK